MNFFEKLQAGEIEIINHTLREELENILNDESWWDAFDQLYHNVQGNVTCDDESRESWDHFPPIPLSPQRAFGKLVVAMRVAKTLWFEKINFMDCGCGGGNILNLASKAAKLTQPRGFEATGIELRKDVVTAARLFTPPSVTVHQGDIIKFKDYKKFNMIYYYCPIKNDLLEVLFEERLEDMVEVGTIIVPTLKKSITYMEDCRFKTLRPDIKGDFYGNKPLIMIKVSKGPRKRSSIGEYDMQDIPTGYKAMLHNHIRGTK